MVAADFVWNLHVLIDAHSGLSELGGLPYIELEKEYHARFGHTFNPYRFFCFLGPDSEGDHLTILERVPYVVVLVKTNQSSSHHSNILLKTAQSSGISHALFAEALVAHQLKIHQKVWDSICPSCAACVPASKRKPKKTDMVLGIRLYIYIYM